MRSYNAKSNQVKLYPEFLKEAGYYCTNNKKTDYNIDKRQTQDLWDEQGHTAHYQNRPAGQPFFAIFNIGISHEVTVHREVPKSQLRHQPENVPLPPYHPATPEIKHDWAKYYDRVEDMDTQVGNILFELENSGEADNTIVFYYSDHGGVLGRSKRFVYETGTRVPFILHVPEKFKHLFPADKPGDAVDRLISFVDLAPTLLSMVDIPIPDFMQGKAFLGKQKTSDPEYVYMFSDRMDERYDLVRAVRDKKYRYIRNYMPYRPNGQHLNYLWNAASVRSWEKAYLNGECDEKQSAFWKEKPVEELYDTENDPWEVNNLVYDPAYKNVLDRMREANKAWISNNYDTGFIPESDLLRRTAGKAPYDVIRNNDWDLDTIRLAALKASCGRGSYRKDYRNFLKHPDSAVRYWGATGLLMLKDGAKPAIHDLEKALKDSSAAVRIVAAEALYGLGNVKVSIVTLHNLISHEQPEVRCRAMNTIDCLGITDPNIQLAVQQLLINDGEENHKRVDVRIARWLNEKWSREE